MDKSAGDRISRTFCVLPWIHRFTNIGGEIQVCCVAEEYHEAVLDDQGQKLNITRTMDDNEIMNSQFMKDVRLKMLKGEWPSLCKRCTLTEDHGGVSRRMNENEKFNDVIDSVARSTAEDGTIPVKVMSLDFRLGNLCNLACRMCNPRSSSSWIRDWKKIDQTFFATSDEQLEEYKSYDWYKNKEVWAKAEAQLPNLRHLHFAGGEPMIAREMTDFLKVAVESGYSKNIELSYNTNITKIPPRCKELWPHFKHVTLLCSIDGFGKLNEFIRHPSDWKQIDRNLRDLDANFDKYGITNVFVMTTLQVYNVLALESLYDYLATQFKRIVPIPFLINLHHPQYYCTQALPPELKTQARHKLEAIHRKTTERINKGEIYPQFAYILDSLKEAISFMEMNDLSSEAEAFYKAAKSTDLLRNQKFEELVPELAAMIPGSTP